LNYNLADTLADAKSAVLPDFQARQRLWRV